MLVRILSDGGARGNPGPAGIGAVIRDEAGAELARISDTIGVATNNIAEYMALIRALQTALALGATAAEVLTDSELMCRQMNGQYKVKHENMKPLHAEAKRLVGQLERFSIENRPRADLAEADALVNAALDRAAG